MKFPRFGSRSTRARKATVQGRLSRRRQLLPEALEPRLMMAVLNGTTENIPILSLSDPTPAVVSVQNSTAPQPGVTVSGAALDALQGAPTQGAPTQGAPTQGAPTQGAPTQSAPPQTPAPPSAPPQAPAPLAGTERGYNIVNVERLSFSYVVPVTKSMAAEEKQIPRNIAVDVVDITNQDAALNDRLNRMNDNLITIIPNFDSLKKLYENLVNAARNPDAANNVRAGITALIGAGAQSWLERLDVVAYYHVIVARPSLANPAVPETRHIIYKVSYFVTLTDIDGYNTGVPWIGPGAEDGRTKALNKLGLAMGTVDALYDNDLPNDGTNNYGKLNSLAFLLWEKGIRLTKTQPKW
jgi:hypothetical protein